MLDKVAVFDDLIFKCLLCLQRLSYRLYYLPYTSPLWPVLVLYANLSGQSFGICSYMDVNPVL